MKYRTLTPIVDVNRMQIIGRGQFVYSCSQPDYGVARNDTNAFGIQHISVTLNADGTYPFFSVARAYLEKVE